MEIQLNYHAGTLTDDCRLFEHNVHGSSIDGRLLSYIDAVNSSASFVDNT